MKDDTAILEIFRDPILTLIALICLSTLWIVVPGWSSESADSCSAEDLLRLQEEVSRIERRIRELEEAIRRLVDEARAIAALRDEAAARGEDAASALDRLAEEISGLRAMIENQRGEIEALERRLEAVRAREGEARVVDALARRVAELKREIAEKEQLLRALESELAAVERANEQREAEARELASSCDELRRQVEAEEGTVRELEARKAKLRDELELRDGMGEYTEEAVAGKTQITVEAVKNRAVVVNDKNYSVEHYWALHNGKEVYVSERNRKSSARGESSAELAKAGSEYRAALREADPSTHCVFIGVQSDSFEAFRAARKLAWEMGFAVCWAPWGEGPIYGVPDGGGDEGR